MEGKCEVCYLEIEENPVLCLGCKADYHQYCIDQILKSDDRCPMCKHNTWDRPRQGPDYTLPEERTLGDKVNEVIDRRRKKSRLDRFADFVNTFRS